MQMDGRLKKRLLRARVNLLLAILLAFGGLFPAMQSTGVRIASASESDDIIYVTVTGGVYGQDGTSWETALSGDQLQDAIDRAEPGTEIWVAEGTYTPTEKVDGTENRHRAFRLKNGVAIYGGFPANPDADTDWDDRNWEDHPTILSGDLDQNDDPDDLSVNRGDNAYHVIHIPAGMTLDATTVLDGFTITGGNGEDKVSGGGILLNSGSPTLRNLLIEGNEANMGGGMYIENSSPGLEQVTFRQNKAIFVGGGAYVAVSGQLVMSNGSFENNESGTNGGGLFLSSGTGVAAELKNVTISGNKSVSGAGIYSAAILKLEDVTIRDNSSIGAQNTLGGGLYQLEGAVTMTGVTLERNTAFGGGAASLNNTNATLKDVMVNQNTATGNGGGLVVSGSTLTAMNVIVAGNEASHAGGLFLSSLQSATLTNVLVSGNKATGNGGGVMFQFQENPVNQENYTLTNATISGNTAKTGGGIIITGFARVTVRNSIVWGNDAENGKNVLKSGGNSYLGFAYSLIEGSGGSDEWNDAFGENLGGNIDADPDFVDAEPATEAPTVAGDYRLTYMSPAVDAGDDSAFAGDLSQITDLAGEPRKRYDAVDMGAYEWASIYVTEDGAGDQDGSSWDNAYPGSKLQDAIDGAHRGAQIWVAAGTYTPTKEVGGTGDRFRAFQLKDGVAIYGGFPANPSPDTGMDDRDWTKHPTILSGDLGAKGDNSDNAYHVVHIPEGMTLEETAVLDGFTITGGNANELGQANGGGILIKSGSPTLRNLLIEGNEAGNSGGGLAIENNSNPVLEQVSFKGNKAGLSGGGAAVQSGNLKMSGGSFEDNESGGSGGGLFATSLAGTVKLENVTISGNKAAKDGGAGIYSLATLNLEDVTIKDNTNTNASSSSGGGIIQLGGSLSLTRVVLEGNNAVNGGAMLLMSTTATLNDVTIKRNTATGNGGGINVSGATLTATNMTVVGNEAANGGGLYLNASQPSTLTNVLISGNKATGNGGGVYFQGQGNYTLTNVTISGNAAAKGGGIYQNLSGTGEGIVRNSIVWGNDATEGKNVSKPGGELHFANSLIEGSGGSDEWNDAFGNNLVGNIDADPLFADAKPAGEAPSTEGDYRLTNSSPAIDAGDDGVFEDDATPDLSGISTDLAGKPRKRYDAVDMGAYEFLDETAPSITDKTPASGAENVATDVKLVLKFDEPVKPVAGKMIKVWTSEDTVAADSVATAATVNGTTVTITLSSKLSNDTEYYVTIDQGAFVDRADNEVEAIADKTAWTFTTAAADDEPGDDEPGNEQPGDDEPGNEQPGDDEPGNEQPGDDEPGNEQPGDDEPGNEQPGDEEPGDEQPGDDEPGNGGNPSPSQPANPSPSQPAPTAPAGVDVLVNGKAESAGTLETGTREGRTVATVTLDESRLEERLAEEGRGTVVTVPVSAGSEIVVGELNGRMVKAMEASEAILEIRTDRAAYTLPASQIRIDALSERIGSEVALQDIKVQVEIAEPAAETVQAVESAAADGSFTLVVPPIEFTVRAVHGDTIIEVEKFTAYVERLVAIPEGADPERITTAVVVDPDGAVRHVPTRVELIDGRYYARVNSLTNSTYAVIWNPVEFVDVADHWSKSAVNNMGSRKVIEGIGGGRFEPDRNMTRAEFAAVIVRALGLKPENSAAPFTDVRESDWHGAFVRTAHAYGLITGFDDGAFRPDERITREQAMTIIARAMELTNLKAKLPEAADGEVLLAFGDAAEVSGWAKAAIADNIRVGIVTGRSGSELAPKSHVTRAEVAAMVERLLIKSGLI